MSINCWKCGQGVLEIATVPKQYFCPECCCIRGRDADQMSDKIEWENTPTGSVGRVVTGPPPMRSEHDIRNMIDYLTARDPQHPDLVAFRWMLGEQLAGVNAEVLAALEEAKQIAESATQQANASAQAMRLAGGKITQQAAEIADLREKLSRFVTPPQRMGQ